MSTIIEIFVDYSKNKDCEVTINVFEHKSLVKIVM